MSDLIYRQTAIEAIEEDKIDLDDSKVVAVFKATGDFEKAETQVMTCHRHIKILKDLPSAQPEIIRCKDCKHRPFDSEDTQGFGVEFPDERCPCQCDDGWYNWRPNNEWFCANGERRTDETD